MSGRVRIRFNKNKDSVTREYHVYRSNSPGVDRNSMLILKVQHTANPTPVLVIGENPVQISATAFKLKYSQVMANSPYTVMANGLSITADKYTLDAENGIMTFRLLSDVPSQMAVDYTFDGIEAIDDDIGNSAIVDYYGPAAQKMIMPTPPSGTVFIVADDHVSGQLGFTVSSVYSQMFYYRIDAVTASGDRSPLCNEQSMRLSGQMDKYQIQSSIDNGKTWVIDGETISTQYTITRLDRKSPEPPTVKTVIVTKTGESAAQVAITWQVPFANALPAAAPLYRVTAKTVSGTLSLPSDAFGGNMVKTAIEKVVIRRKTFDATYPTYDGGDAITIATITDLISNQYTDAIQQYVKYAYSIFVVDRAGNHSIAATFTVQSVN